MLVTALVSLVAIWAASHFSAREPKRALAQQRSHLQTLEARVTQVRLWPFLLAYRNNNYM